MFALPETLHLRNAFDSKPLERSHFREIQVLFRAAHLVKEFLRNSQMSQVVLHGGRIVFQQSVRIAQGIASLNFK